jgi:hypothetical protein
MTKSLNAVFENGAFHPVGNAHISLSNGDRVRLTVEPILQDAGRDVLKLAANVYAGLSGEDVAEIERIALDRTTFFSR